MPRDVTRWSRSFPESEDRQATLLFTALVLSTAYAQGYERFGKLSNSGKKLLESQMISGHQDT
jgi:hypothetical protein